MKRTCRVARRASAALIFILPVTLLLIGCAKLTIPETDSSPPKITLRLASPGIDLKEAYGEEPGRERSVLFREGKEHLAIFNRSTSTGPTINADTRLQFLATATDEQSGVSFVSVGSSVEYACGTLGFAETESYSAPYESQYVRAPDGTGLEPGDEVGRKLSVPLGYRLREIEELCPPTHALRPRLDPCGGTVHVTARNGLGVEATSDYFFCIHGIRLN